MNESSPAESVEEKLASELGWDLKLFHGDFFQVPGLDLRMRAEYAIVNPEAFFLPGQARLSHLRLTKWLKFGNSIEQLHHLFYLAKAYQVDRIVVPPSTVFQPGTVAGVKLLTSGSADVAELGVGLAGVFYYLEPFGLKRPTEELLPNVQSHVRALLADSLRAA